MIARRFVIGGGLTALTAACSGPSLLSGLNRVAGGGAGSRLVARGLPFGAHGQGLYVYRPAGGGEGLPVVVFFYGGSWQEGRREDYSFAGRALAGQGFVAVLPDYRKVPAVRFPSFVEDGADALAHVHAHVADWGGDPARIAVAGHSAGAYIALMLALDQAYATAAGAPTDVVKAAVGLSGPYDFLPLSGAAVPAMAGVADLSTTQPIRYARPDAPPTFLATGSDDTLVRPRNSEALAARLKALGAPVTLKVYPGLGHAATAMALARPFRGKAPELADITAFLRTAMPGV